MRTFCCVLVLFFISLNGLIAQKSLLQSGPMLGYSEMREALLWVQTTEAATVQFTYWPQGDAAQKQWTDIYELAVITNYNNNQRRENILNHSLIEKMEVRGISPIALTRVENFIY